MVPASDKHLAVDSVSRTVKVVGSITITDLEMVVADTKEGM